MLLNNKFKFILAFKFTLELKKQLLLFCKCNKRLISKKKKLNTYYYVILILKIKSKPLIIMFFLKD